MQGLQLVRYNTRNFQPAGIGTNIDGGESWHAFVTSPKLIKKDKDSGVTIHERGGSSVWPFGSPHPTRNKRSVPILCDFLLLQGWESTNLDPYSVG
jgi:hypothetical protein